MAGMRFDSAADMPEGMRKLYAKKVALGSPSSGSTGGASGMPRPTGSGPMRASAPTGEADPSTPLRSAQDDSVSKKPNKYRNVETVVDGIRFQSIKESRRFQYLKLAQELGVIEDLRLQVDFTLQEGYKTVKGERIRAIRYVADFTYKVKCAGYDHSHLLEVADLEYWRSLWPGTLVIEDTKSRGTRTKEYKIKRKLMADKGHEIREV